MHVLEGESLGRRKESLHMLLELKNAVLICRASEASAVLEGIGIGGWERGITYRLEAPPTPRRRPARPNRKRCRLRRSGGGASLLLAGQPTLAFHMLNEGNQERNKASRAQRLISINFAGTPVNTHRGALARDYAGLASSLSPRRCRVPASSTIPIHAQRCWTARPR